jgi:hypothetical protein
LALQGDPYHRDYLSVYSTLVTSRVQANPQYAILKVVHGAVRCRYVAIKSGICGQSKGAMPLTELQIKALKPEAIRYVVSSGRGLALEVMPTGASSWRYR